MKRTFYISTFLIFLITQFLFLNPIKSTPVASADDNWKNWYGIAWKDTGTASAKYSKQMGYDYFAINVKDWITSFYASNSIYKGLKYFIINPHRGYKTVFSGNKGYIDTAQSYTATQTAWYEQRMAWKSNDPFPYNMASGPLSSSTNFAAMWDFQQQAVIDEVVENIMTLFHSYEDAVGPTSAAYPFTFAGYMIDDPKLIGDFYRWDTSTSKGVPTDLTYWTGADSSLIHGTITHEYATYSEGMAAFLKQLNTSMRQDFPNAKWIITPWRIYNATGYGNNAEWVYQISGRSDKDQLTPDMISQEEPSTLFADDNNIYNSGMNITKDMVGISQVSQSAEYENRLYNAKAAINGGWSNWFGLFGEGKNTPYFSTIVNVYPRLKLIRCIPNWDNLNSISLSDRSWDGSVYQSTKSYISSDVLYSRHPKTGKLFAVFNTTNGVIKLNTGETVTSMQNTDAYFIESGDASADFDITGNEIRLKSSVTIDVDSSNNQIKGKGYIFTLKSSGAPTVTTGSATNVTSNSATLNGTVNPDGLSATAWFEYDTISGSYSNKSATQSVSGSSDTTVSISISGLSPAKTYYYRIAAQSSAGTTNGSEMSFTTSDTTAPAGSININSGDSYTNSTAVTLSLSATDDVGITGYYLSSNATTPSASDAGWTSVTSTPSYSGSVSYTLVSGDGKKTVYVSYKDASGNVSSQALDSISLDTTAPAITITNPTYNSTYTTTSSTMSLGGDVSDSASGVSSITWSNDKGGSGTTSGTTGWLFSSITLSSGNNVITVTATDKANNTSIDTITVTYGAAPSVSMGSVTNLTSNSATLNETVNANGLPTTVWFEYGLNSGSYGSKSATQSVNGSSDTTVSISITGLLSGKTYYYRSVAQNSVGTTYGSERSFTTLDTTAPTSSININGGAAYTKSTVVTLALSATDDVGVTGYFFSASATAPSASAVGWTSITSTPSYSGSVSYTLSSGDGSKTVYVWFKDAAGNVSTAASDSITLDTAAPVITFTYPSSSYPYTTSSSKISLGGSASDSTSGVSSITWSSDKGGSGVASGTANWSISEIGLSNGDNAIVITVLDTANNAMTTTITIKYDATPTAATGSASSVTSNTATLNGTVNPNGLSTTIWFEYGMASGTYSNNTSTQDISGSSNVAVSIDINGLLPAKTFYFRVVAQNSAGTAYGSEMSFVTTDTSAPNCSININNGDNYTKAVQVTLTLSATDDVGVTGYYLSDSSLTPSASGAGWITVTSTTSFSADVSYTLNSGDGNKAIYVWYKDTAGNISSDASDSITLDTTEPDVTITSPTSSAAYTATENTIDLSGIASDNMSGVGSVAWSNSNGGSGTASGTTNWSISGVNLSNGDNLITVTVSDGANNTGTTTITVSYSESNGGNGLQALYTFDDGSGTTLTDSSGNGKNGTINEAVWASGKNGSGLKFDGVNDYVSVPLMNNDEISIAAWFYKDSKDTTYADAIFGGWRWNSDSQLHEGFDLRFYQKSPDTINFIVVTQDNSGYRTTKTAQKNLGNSVGSWYHVVGTYNKTTGEQKLYVNGQLVNTQNHTAGNTVVPYTMNANMRIGHSRVNNGYFNGTIDDMRIYNKPLSSQEVQGLYNNGTGLAQ